MNLALPEQNLWIEEVDSDRFAQAFPSFDGSLFMHPKWIEAVSNANSTAVYLQIRNAQRTFAMASGLCLTGNCIQGTQLYLYSSPALIEPDQALYDQSILAIYEYARHHHIQRISIRPWDQRFAQPIQHKMFNRTQTYEYVLSATDSWEISTRVMKNIKKAKKANLLIAESQLESDLEILIQYLSHTMNRRESKHGLHYSPYYIFNIHKESLLKLLKNGMGKMYVAKIEDQIATIEFSLETEKEVYILLKASVDEGYRSGASSFIDYYLIDLFRKKGLLRFNLGLELSEQNGTGLNEYKQGIGCIPHQKHGAYTYYLNYPHALLNPLMKASRNLPEYSWIDRLKKQISIKLSGSGT